MVQYYSCISSQGDCNVSEKKQQNMAGIVEQENPGIVIMGSVCWKKVIITSVLTYVHIQAKGVWDPYKKEGLLGEIKGVFLRFFLNFDFLKFEI